jgi:hypothetical protein
MVRSVVLRSGFLTNASMPVTRLDRFQPSKGWAKSRHRRGDRVKVKAKRQHATYRAGRIINVM